MAHEATKYTKNFGFALPAFRSGPWHELINGNIEAIDSILYGAMSQANVLPWENSTLYTSGVTVLDGFDSTTWMCVVEHTSSAEPITFAEDRTANPTYWTNLLAGFAPRGQWLNDTNYFPYDLVYDSALGIMALCSLKHTSNLSGNIKDDDLYWEYLIDMSDADLATAVSVTYSNAVSPTLPNTNVQEAIDALENQTVGLNNINITQGDQITTIQVKNTEQDASIADIQDTIATQTTDIAALKTKDTAHEATDASLQSQVTDLQTRSTAILLVSPGGNYTCVASDAGKCIKASGGTITIPSNASVPYPLGTCISFAAFGGNILIACGDTMYKAGSALTGTRTLTNVGFATAVKVTTGQWIISGSGLT